MRYIVWMMFCLLSLPAHASVEGWVGDFKQEAAKEGISHALLEEAFADFTPQASVVRLDRRQPEGTMTLARYMHNVVPPARVARAREERSVHDATLSAASARYGVPEEVIVALWAVESNFGENQGNFSVVHALATLAYEGRRASYFRKELLQALKIVDAGHITLDAMTGSWAGAMGQCQFMPTSFLAYAADGDGDGRRDIWNSEADVHASIARYLSSVGWDAHLPILLEVTLPEGFDIARYLRHEKRALAAWQKLGVQVDASVSDTAMLALVRLGKGPSSRIVLATRNFDTLMHWNRSTYFAAAVSALADAM